MSILTQLIGPKSVTNMIFLSQVDADGGPSQRHDSAAEVQGLNVAPWTPEEQQLLEQARKSHRQLEL